MKKLLVFAVLGFSFYAVQGQITYSVEADKSSITYSANHMLHAWEGENDNVLGVAMVSEDVNEIEKLALLLNVRDFNSQNSSRDAHSLEVLEAIKHPTIKFYATHINLQSRETTISGDLTFHGIKKPIQVITRIKNNGNTISLEGSFKVKPTDYKIELPSFMMVKIDDLLELNFKVALKKK